MRQLLAHEWSAALAWANTMARATGCRQVVRFDRHRLVWVTHEVSA